jgi:hypothetical protein
MKVEDARLAFIDRDSAEFPEVSILREATRPRQDRLVSTVVALARLLLWIVSRGLKRSIRQRPDAFLKLANVLVANIQDVKRP